MQKNDLRLRGGELEHEIVGKAPEVPFDGLHQHLGLHSIKVREVATQHHFLAANQKYALLDEMRGKNDLSRHSIALDHIVWMSL